MMSVSRERRREIWCRGAESNCRHQPFQGCALPTELPRHKVRSRWGGGISMFAEVTAPTCVTGLNAENQGNGMEKDAGSPECV